MSEILTPSYLQQVMGGARTTDAAGNPLSDAYYQTFIDSAISWLESTLDLVLTGSPDAVHSERKDSWDWHAEFHYLNNLTLRPIAELVSFGLQYGGFAATDVNVANVIITNRTFGIYRLMSGPGGYALSPWAGLWGAGFGTGRHYDSAYLVFTYKAGFVTTLNGLFTATPGSANVVVGPVVGQVSSDILRDIKAGHYIKIGTDSLLYRVAGVTATRVTLTCAYAGVTTQTAVTAQVYAYDPMMLETAAMMAAIPILESIANYIYGGPGRGGKSLSIDSMSQANHIAVTANQSVYSSQIRVFETRIKANVEALMRKYSRVSVFSL